MTSDVLPSVRGGEADRRDSAPGARSLGAGSHAVAAAKPLLADLRARALGPCAGLACGSLLPADMPLVNLAPFMPGGGGAPAAREAAVDAALGACRRLGAMHVRGHGVADELLHTLRVHCRRFFALSAEDKSKLAAKSVTSRGYHGLGQDKVSAAWGQRSPVSLKENFDIGPPDLPFERNVFPPEELIPGFRDTLERYYAHMERVEQALLAFFSAALARDSSVPLPDDWAQRAIGRHRGLLRVNYYPRESLQQDGLRCRAHTDWDPFTILYAEQEGLEVMQDGHWRAVPVLPGCFVVIFGDTLQCWSNGRFAPAVHRVNAAGSATSDRLSVPFFSTEALDTSDETVAEPIVVAGELPRYKPFCIRDYLVRSFAAQQARAISQAEMLLKQNQ
mmetsp:Transcript_58476/g.187836  ORF Transcript_58476/g.187836 Transcript_58476/m.187836 type:complete len:391 (+) Transcript_58476:47-1219(+)